MGHQPKYLGHVNIFVRNVEHSHRWYTEVLGLHTYGLRPGQVAFLSADLEQSHEIALVQAGEDALAPLARHVGLNHGVDDGDPRRLERAVPKAEGQRCADQASG